MPLKRPSRPRRALLALCLAVLSWVAAPAPAGAAPAAPATSGWPLAGAPVVLAGFDPPDTPWGRGHRGVDLAASVGDLVLTSAGGRVSYAGVLAGRGVVAVDHGGVRTTYEPVDARVALGSSVSAGDVLGTLAAGTHCGLTPCLHWGLKRGDDYLDPLSLAPGSASTPGPLRLLPASARGVAQQRAAARAVVAAAALLATRPVTGPAGRGGFARPVVGAISSPFGRRFHPVLHVWRLHDGTDVAAPCGSPIRAPAPGVVTRRSLSPAYGNRLFLDHGRVGGRHVVTSYNHATHYVVGVGSRVSRGQLLGFVGASGYATGCHLHVMVWLDRQLTDPMSWF